MNTIENAINPELTESQVESFVTDDTNEDLGSGSAGKMRKSAALNEGMFDVPDSTAEETLDTVSTINTSEEGFDSVNLAEDETLDTVSNFSLSVKADFLSSESNLDTVSKVDPEKKQPESTVTEDLDTVSTYDEGEGANTKSDETLDTVSNAKKKHSKMAAAARIGAMVGRSERTVRRAGKLVEMLDLLGPEYHEKFLRREITAKQVLEWERRMRLLEKKKNEIQTPETKRIERAQMVKRKCRLIQNAIKAYEKRILEIQKQQPFDAQAPSELKSLYSEAGKIGNALFNGCYFVLKQYSCQECWGGGCEHCKQEVTRGKESGSPDN